MKRSARRVLFELLAESDPLTAEELEGLSSPSDGFIQAQLDYWQSALPRLRRTRGIALLWLAVTTALLYGAYPVPHFWTGWGAATVAVTAVGILGFLNAEIEVVRRRVMFYRMMRLCLTYFPEADATDS